MNKDIESKYVKRTQKDYSTAFKLGVVGEVGRGELSIGAAARKYGVQNHSTVTNWSGKYGSSDWESQTPSNMPQTTPSRCISNPR